MRKLASIFLITFSGIGLLTSISSLITNLDYIFSDEIWWWKLSLISNPFLNLSLMLVGIYIFNDNGKRSIESSNQDDSSDIILNIVSFIAPFIGLIIYIVLKDNSPRKASGAGKFALIGFCFVYLLFLIPVILFTLTD